MKYIIANWKIKLSPQEESALAGELTSVKFDTNQLTVALAPTFLSIQSVREIIKNSALDLSAQDCFWAANGAYTGEISPLHLKSLGANYIIIGHSERRQHLGESSTLINKKIHAVIDEGLTPILCVGESQEERHSGNKDHIIQRAVQLALHNIELVGAQKLLVAYEPIWAIGSGQAAQLSEVEYMHRVIYQTLIDLFPRTIVENNTAILYGGSVDSSNVAEFLKNPVVNGVLVGSASTRADEFSTMIAHANN